ncbi:MAG: hypothetical protein ABI401_06435 [Candidatus Dormibacter sp.]
MTVKLRPGAIWTTLGIYLFILAGSLITLVVLGPITVSRFKTGADLFDLVSVLLLLLAIFMVVTMINSFAAFARIRIHADAERVWIPRPFGRREVYRRDLMKIRAGRLTSLPGRGMRVFRFMTRDGREAFHVQAVVFPRADMESLASYLDVPIDFNFSG